MIERTKSGYPRFANYYAAMRPDSASTVYAAFNHLYRVGHPTEAGELRQLRLAVRYGIVFG